MVKVYIFLHVTVVNHLQSCYLGHSHRLFINLLKTGREPVLLSLATMAEGETTPVVEAKRLVEREEEGMSQSYHEIFDTQVSLWNLIRIRHGTILGLPHWRSKPLHNLESSRRQQWKWGECCYMPII